VKIGKDYDVGISVENTNLLDMFIIRQPLSSSNSP